MLYREKIFFSCKKKNNTITLYFFFISGHFYIVHIFTFFIGQSFNVMHFYLAASLNLTLFKKLSKSALVLVFMMSADISY